MEGSRDPFPQRANRSRPQHQSSPTQLCSSCHGLLLTSPEAGMAPQPQSPPHPIPPPVPVETHPNRAGGLKPPLPQRVPPDPTRLAPEHAYYAAHLQQRPWHDSSAHARPIDGAVSISSSSAAVAALRPPPAVPGYESGKIDPRKPKHRRRKKRKGAWKKLMWIQQSCMQQFLCICIQTQQLTR